MAESIEGRNAVLEALRADMPLSVIFIAQGADDKALADIVREAQSRGITVESAQRQKLDTLSVRGAHQGVVARLNSFEFTELGTILEGAAREDRVLIVALDSVTDPQNLGAIARTLEVAGGAGLIITKRRSAGVGAAAFKASAGALAHLPVARETNLVRTLEHLKGEGFWVVGASHRASQTMWESQLPEKMVLVMGSEGSGLSRLVDETCDLHVSIPMFGRTESLNVGQATTAIVYEWLRRGSE